MTNAPSDLLNHRHDIMGVTGFTDPAEVGIVGDAAHAAHGGYHMGEPEVYPGSDYSTSLQRDRNGLSTSASAVDYGDDWPHGGRAAWLRFNNALAAALKANTPELAAVRAINYSPDGTTKKRIDRQNGWHDESTSDTVTVHTHAEFYRDTEGNRTTTLNYITKLAQQAITGGSMTTGDDVWNYKIPAPDNAGRSAAGVQKDVGDLRNALASPLGHIPSGYAKPGDGTYFGAFLAMLDAYAAGTLFTVVLSDEQISQIADQVAAGIEAGATPAQVREQVISALNATKLAAS